MQPPRKHFNTEPKLTKEAVQYIRANYKPYKKSYRFFANKYKVGESTIRDVVQYYTWYWV